MGKRIRAALDRVYCIHRRAILIAEGWLLVALMVGGGFGIGYLVGGMRVDSLLASQSLAHSAEVERMQQANRDLLVYLAPKVKDAADTAKDAADLAKDAAKAATGAGTAARSASDSARKAASVAKSAATTASEAAADVKEAVTPLSVEPKDPPDWLGGS